MNAEPHLSSDEKKDARQRSSVRVGVIHEAIRADGEAELARSARALAYSAFAAGLSMSFSVIGKGVLWAALPDVPYRALIANLAYPVGFIVVIMGKQQLFTENTLTVILPLMSRLNLQTLRSVVRLWAVVLGGNLAGLHVIAWTLGNTSALDADVKTSLTVLASHGMDLSPGTVFLKGIFAGWLIALVVWLRAAVNTGQVFIIAILTYLVAVGDFPHVIAGTIEVLYLVAVGAQSWTHVMWSYFLPSLGGNIVGGVWLVAWLNHAQTVTEKTRQRGPRLKKV